MKTTYDQSDVQTSLRNVIQRIKQININVSNHSMIEHKHMSCVATKMQTIFAIKHDDHLEAKLHELILSYALNSEKTSPGTFNDCISMIVERLEEHLIGFNNKSVERHSCDVLTSFRPNASNLCKLIDDEYVNSNVSSCVYEMLKTAINTAGFGGRIFVEKTSGIPHVEISSGHVFDFSPSVNTTGIFKDVKICIIDGFIESVAELHPVLQGAHDDARPLVLFCRNITEDVLHTIKVNNERKSFEIIPYVISFDFDGLNALRDLATITNSDIISSDKGQLISCIDYTKLATADKIDVRSSKIIISSNKLLKNSINSLVNEIRSKIESSPREELSKLYDKRLRSLSSRQIIIRLLDDNNYSLSAQYIDSVLRKLRSLLQHGTIDGKLASNVVTTQVFSEKCVTQIKSIGYAIKED